MLDMLRAAATVKEGRFRAWDDMAVELEVAELLYGLVRASKPDLVVEAGTGNGYASRFIAAGLQANGRGFLVTYEHDEEYAKRTARTLGGLPVEVINGVSSEHEGDPDMVFIDSYGHGVRDGDLGYWLANPGPLLVVHDANRYDLPGGTKLTAGRGVWMGYA